MLPQCRTEGDVFSIPKFTIEKGDVKEFIEEFKTFHNEFRDCFSRSEPKQSLFRYMVGQFSELERKSIEPIALNVENGNVRSMQRFISDIIWDEEKIMHKYRSMVSEDLGDPNGILIFDETGFVKKGITLSQLRILIEVVLPLRFYDIENALDSVRWIQIKNHRAYLSHRKKKLKNL